MSWTFENKPFTKVPKDAYGFIYKIVNTSNNRVYIGEKQFNHCTNPAISHKKYLELKSEGVEATKTKHKKKSTKGNVVWIYKRKNVIKETNWKVYTGSSDELNDDILRGDSIEKSILHITYSKREHTTREVIEIVKADCLESCDCYNKQILGRLFQLTKC